jgi:indolepyruvate ferredoxin oxidoreductase beta subunit
VAGAPLTVLVCALGGEGGGVLAEWLYSAAVRAGHAAQSTSIPGVAQRTGATTYYIEIARVPGEAVPFCLSPVPGGIDLLVSSELLEALRQAGAGMVSPDRTHLVSASTRALTVAEKVQQGDGRFDAAAAAQALRAHAKAVQLIDLAALARQADTAMSAVLLGAIAGSAVLPLAREAYEEAIRAAGKGVAASLRGFALAFERVRAGEASAVAPAAPSAPSAPSAPARAGPQAPDPIALARARVAAYQDERYAELFDARLARLREAEGGAGSAGDPATPATPVMLEAARWLALWMCFDDIVQVARLKLAASRMARVRREAGAGALDVLKVYDHFKPGVPEIAALLPQALATRLLAWERRRIAAGREPFGLALKVGSHSLIGVLALRLASALKGQRRRGQRFAIEQALIDEWWGAVVQGTRESAELGLELARCGRLVKGYGSTNERGKGNLLHIVRHLGAHAEAVRAARTAALADEAGQALDSSLVAHGAPPRAPREQVVRWYKRRPAAAEAR